MKRILALLLTVVLLALALTGCAYNYEKKSADLVSFDKAAFEAALMTLTVEDGDFGDTENRNTLVWDSLQKSLASAAGTDDQQKTGNADDNDVIYYCYYAVDGEGNQFFTSSNMKSGSEVNFQNGLSGLGGLNVKVSEVITSYDFAGTYSANTDEQTPTVGMFVSVSYKMTKAGTDTTVTNQIVKLDDTANADLVGLYTALQAATVGTVVHDEDKTNVLTVGADETAITFTDAKVDYVVVGTPIEISYVETDDTQRTAANGTKKSLKDENLTYYVYPVSYVDVSDYGVAAVVSELISSISNTSLDLFNTDGTDTDLYTKAKAYVDAKTEYEAAKETWEDAEEADKATAETAMNEKKSTMDTALTELVTADSAAYDALDADAKAKAEDRKVTGSAIGAAYFESIYQSKLSGYNSEMQGKIYAAIYDEIEKITVNEIPEKAVKNTYNDLMDAYECTFYNGTSTKDTSVSNYKYYGDLAKDDDSNATAFELYLMAETASETADEAKEFVKEQAKSIVESTVRVFALADAYGVKLTKKEYKTESNTYSSSYSISASYSYTQVAFTEEATKTAIVFDRLMAVLAKSTTDDAGELSWDMVAIEKKMK